MRWEMETEEIEAAMERIWDLHDKVSDAIHCISRAHFFHSVRAARGGGRPSHAGNSPRAVGGGGSGGGFVFVKGFPEEKEESLVAEARSLHLIRSALENLEDQLEFLHSVQSQQQTERDAAIARLEQSRIILAMRLADHQGKKYKVIDEALAFVGDGATPKDFSDRPTEVQDRKRPSIFKRMLVSSVTSANKLLRLVITGGVIGNAALFSISLVAAFQLHQVTSRGLLLEASPMQKHFPAKKSVENSTSKMNWSSQNEKLKRLDVLSAKG